jgi:hypothetical protein
VTKQRDPESGQQSLLFEIDYPEIADGVIPRHRFMSAYEQKIEPPGYFFQSVALGVRSEKCGLGLFAGLGDYVVKLGSVLGSGLRAQIQAHAGSGFWFM